MRSAEHVVTRHFTIPEPHHNCTQAIAVHRPTFVARIRTHRLCVGPTLHVRLHESFDVSMINTEKLRLFMRCPVVNLSSGNGITSEYCIEP